MMYVREYGAQCGWEWITMKVLQRVCDVLDKQHPLGSDYRMLAEVLDVPETKLQQFLRFCSTSPDQTITRVILQVQYFMMFIHKYSLAWILSTYWISDFGLQENLARRPEPLKTSFGTEHAKGILSCRPRFFLNYFSMFIYKYITFLFDIQGAQMLRYIFSVARGYK